MLVTLIAGMAGRRVIGNRGMIPWKRMPADMKHIRELAEGHTLVMGSETMRSMMRYKSPLLGLCPIIVLTRGEGWEFLECNFRVAHSLEEAITLAQASDETMLCLFGGGQIYTEALAKDLVQRVSLTVIQTDVEGDTFFPDLPQEAWAEVSREEYTADAHNPYPYAFVTYERSHS